MRLLRWHFDELVPTLSDGYIALELHNHVQRSVDDWCLQRSMKTPEIFVIYGLEVTYRAYNGILGQLSR